MNLRGAKKRSFEYMQANVSVMAQNVKSQTTAFTSITKARRSESTVDKIKRSMNKLETVMPMRSDAGLFSEMGNFSNEEDALLKNQLCDFCDHDPQ